MLISNVINIYKEVFYRINLPNFHHFGRHVTLISTIKIALPVNSTATLNYQLPATLDTILMGTTSQVKKKKFKDKKINSLKDYKNLFNLLFDPVYT